MPRDPGYGMEGWGLGRWVVLVLIPLASLIPHPSRAQTVVEVLQEQRRAARLAEVLAERGPRLAPRGPVELGEPDEWTARFLALQAAERARRDSIRAVDEARADSIVEAIRLARPFTWRKVPAGEQGPFVEQFREVFWRATGSRGDLFIDTTATAALRGRLEAAFGAPTRNADAERRHGYGGSEYIQFEYWFVVNDSIPVLALDLDGPFGTGLLVATDERQGALTDRLRRGLSERLAAVPRRDPWLDYYHSFDRGQWYRVGYNGADDFAVEVRPPSWRGAADPDLWIIHR